MPIHWFWIVALLIIIGVTVAVVAGLARAGGGHSEYRPPVLSPDGRYWWDGRKWQPMPPASPPASTSGPGKA